MKILFYFCRRKGMKHWTSLFVIVAIALLFVGCESADKYWNPECNEDVGEAKGVGKLKMTDEEGLILLPGRMWIGQTDAMKMAWDGALIKGAIASKGKFLPLAPVMPEALRTRLRTNYICWNFRWLARAERWEFRKGSSYARDFEMLGKGMSDLMGLVGPATEKLGMPKRTYRYLGFIDFRNTSMMFGLLDAWRLCGGVWDLEKNKLARFFDFVKAVPPDNTLKIAALVAMAGDLEELLFGPMEPPVVEEAADAPAEEGAGDDAEKS
jgi:hypothetical protein